MPRWDAQGNLIPEQQRWDAQGNPVTAPASRSLLDEGKDVVVGAAKGLASGIQGLFAPIIPPPGSQIPVVGARPTPNYNLEATNTAQRVGKIGEGIAEVAVPFISAGRTSKTLKLLSAPAKQWNAKEQAAIDFIKSLGVKPSLGQELGSESLQRTEKALVNVPGAATTAQKFFANQEQSIATAGKKLAGQVSPSGQETALGAGQSLADRLYSRIRQAKDFADKRYSQVRSIATNPRNASKVQVGEEVSSLVDASGNPIVKPILKTFETATDISQSQKALRPIYDELLKSMPEFQRQNSPGFAALRQIVEGPGVVDALTADKNLSAVKALMRQGSNKYLSSQSQRLAAKTVDALSMDFETALSKAGGNGVEKLAQARKAVARYHDIAEVLGSLPKNSAGELEPAAVYQKLVGGGDKQIELLQTLKTYAPRETTELGHTFLQGLLEKATAEGGFGRSAGILADWSRMGPATKKLMFGDNAAQIDKFLLAAKRLTVDVNPSGTAKQLLALGPAGIILGDMIFGPGTITDKIQRLPVEAATVGLTSYGAKRVAQLLLDKAGGELLVKGLTVNVGNPSFQSIKGLLNLAISRNINPSKPPASNTQHTQ